MKIAPLVVVVIFFIGIVGCRGYLVSWASFFPMRGMQVDPAHFDAPIEQVFLDTEDGVRIHAFYLPREGATRTILFLHGNAGNASHRLDTAVRLWELDANVLLLDYRGYGLSEGRPNEKGIYLDARAGLKHLTQTLNIPIEQVAIFGRSIGSAVAIEIAQGEPFAGLILVSPLTSGREVAGLMGLGWIAPLTGRPFDSLAKLPNVHAPILVIHGERDDIIPPEMGRTVYERFEGTKEFLSVPGAGHNDVIELGGGAIFPRLVAFLNAPEAL